MPEHRAGATSRRAEVEQMSEPLALARRVHMVGVGGSGMSSLATLLSDMGIRVSGSDAGAVSTLAWLAARGIEVHQGHDGDPPEDVDLVITSAAIPSDNPELLEARRRGLPVRSHAQALGALMSARRGLGVAGTHGKSTTTALIAYILNVAGRDPTLVGGAEALDFGASSRLGHGAELVAEADEYGRRLLELHPEIAVITGVEPDHLDYYHDIDEIIAVFRQFVDGMPPDGDLVTSEDEPTLAGMELPRRRVRYGWASTSDWRLCEHRPAPGGGGDVRISDPTGRQRVYHLRLTGRHNAENALAALVVADLLGIDESHRRSALATFRGTRRRFESRARLGGVWIVDDYAHHPTAVRATLRAAREVHEGPIWAVFQPHTTNRTAALLDHFAGAFGDADHVLMTPIYRPTGRERAAAQVTTAHLVARMTHQDARALGSLDEAFSALQPALESGTLILTLGAGDIVTLADRLAQRVLCGES